jgi:hypothetical protein
VLEIIESDTTAASPASTDGYILLANGPFAYLKGSDAIGTHTRGPILLNSRGARMDRHAATRHPDRAHIAHGPSRGETPGIAELRMFDLRMFMRPPA